MNKEQAITILAETINLAAAHNIFSKASLAGIQTAFDFIQKLEEIKPTDESKKEIKPAEQKAK